MRIVSCILQVQIAGHSPLNLHKLAQGKAYDPVVQKEAGTCLQGQFMQQRCTTSLPPSLSLVLRVIASDLPQLLSSTRADYHYVGGNLKDVFALPILQKCFDLEMGWAKKVSRNLACEKYWSRIGWKGRVSTLQSAGNAVHILLSLSDTPITFNRLFTYFLADLYLLHALTALVAQVERQSSKAFDVEGEHLVNNQ
jgi:hypothetical protein